MAISKQQVVSGLATAILVLKLASAPLAGVAPDRAWLNGTILDIDSTARLLAKEEDALTRTVRRGSVYAVQSDRFIYLTEEMMNRGRSARFKGGSAILFAIEGDKLYILGDDERERETQLIKKVERPEGQGLLPRQIALQASGVTGREINACKYLAVSDFTSDPAGLANELRAQARAKGFVVALSASDVPVDEQLKMCVMRGSWSVGGFQGHVDMQVLDASGSLVAEVAASVKAMVSVRRAVRAIVANIYSQLRYTGFSEDVYQQRLQREYPPRPMRLTTEEEIKKSEPHSPVEGIWTDTEDRYRLGIVPSSERSSGDYVAIVLRSNTPLWRPGEIKAEIRSTASPDVFTCTYFMQNKKPVGTTLIVEHNSVLRGSTANTTTPPFNLLLVRVWPRVSEDTARGVPSGGEASGTGFLLNRGGLIATNWHVVADAKNISVAFPSWNGSVGAEVVVRDKANDLAVLRLTDIKKLETTCREIPFQLASSDRITLGERVSTVGFPLTPMLGSSPKFSEGVISSKSGLQDDPRTLQVSAQVQPGSSGSPLFDEEGNIIGIVVATLDAGRVIKPQAPFLRT